MKMIMIRLFLGVHIFLYRLTGGKMGGKMGGMPVLLLHSIGRKTGQIRTTPVAYIRDGENYVVTASNGGAANHPGWYYNLRHEPQVTIQVMDETMSVTAEQADAENRARLWAELVRVAPNFESYKQKTSRQIAMFILQPVN